MHISALVTPIVVCGVVMYFNRNVEMHPLREPPLEPELLLHAVYLRIDGKRLTSVVNCIVPCNW